MKNIVVTQNPEKEVPAEVMAQSIVEIGAAMRKISMSRLNRDALVALIHDTSKINKTEIRIVLNCLEALESLYLKPSKKA